MKYNGMVNGNLTINENSSVSGMVNGNLFVEESVSVSISGSLNGHLYLKKGSAANISGMVSGNIYKEDTSVSLKKTGIVNGKIFTNHIEEKADNDFSPNDTQQVVMNNGVHIGGSFKNSKYTINNNHSSIALIGNKRVRLISTNGISINNVNGKTLVNGIDLATLTPDEEGIYTI